MTPEYRQALEKNVNYMHMPDFKRRIIGISIITLVALAVTYGSIMYGLPYADQRCSSVSVDECENVQFIFEAFTFLSSVFVLFSVLTFTHLVFQKMLHAWGKNMLEKEK